MLTAGVLPPPGTFISPRAAVGAMFFAFGTTIGLWGGSVAEVARIAAVAPEVIGSAFVGFNVAGILGMALAGRFGSGFSLKARLLVLVTLAALCFALLYQVRSAIELVAGLFAFSFLAATVDLVMNSEGLAVEQDAGVPVLAGFHGLASLGVAFGAILGSYLSVVFGLAAAASVGVGVYGLAALAVLVGTPDRGVAAPGAAAPRLKWPPLPLIAIGVIVGASIACEIAAIMFSGQTIVSQAPHLAAYAGFGATAYALCQAGIRLIADRLRRRLGDEALVRLSLATALAGFLVVSLSTGFVGSALGFAIVGFGTACIVPCGFAIGARMSAMPATAVIGMLAIVGGSVRIPAPLVYGIAVEHVGFARAFALYALLAALGLVLAFAVAGSRFVRRSS